MIVDEDNQHTADTEAYAETHASRKNANRFHRSRHWQGEKMTGEGVGDRRASDHTSIALIMMTTGNRAIRIGRGLIGHDYWMDDCTR